MSIHKTKIIFSWFIVLLFSSLNCAAHDDADDDEDPRFRTPTTTPTKVSSESAGSGRERTAMTPYRTPTKLLATRDAIGSPLDSTKMRLIAIADENPSDFDRFADRLLNQENNLGQLEGLCTEFSEQDDMHLCLLRVFLKAIDGSIGKREPGSVATTVRFVYFLTTPRVKADSRWVDFIPLERSGQSKNLVYLRGSPGQTGVLALYLQSRGETGELAEELGNMARIIRQALDGTLSIYQNIFRKLDEGKYKDGEIPNIMTCFNSAVEAVCPKKQLRPAPISPYAPAHRDYGSLNDGMTTPLLGYKAEKGSSCCCCCVQ